MIKWLQNLKKDIGQSQHQDLWHYAEKDPISIAKRIVEDAPSVVPSCQKNRQVERAEGE